jgi:Protein of unknown function (DUF4013)
MSTRATPTPAGSGTIDFAKCFTFAVEDPDWIKKMLFGGLFSLLCMLIVGIFFVAGYWVRFFRRVVAGDARPLPEWDDFGGIFNDGLKVVGVYFTYVAGMVVVFLALGCAVGLLGAGIGSLSRSSEGAGSAAAALGGLGMAAAYGIIMVLAFALAIFMPAVMVRVILKDSFGEAFAFREHLAFIKANVANYGLSLVVYLVANFASQFGALLCCVGVFPAVFWSYLIFGYALGERVRMNPRSV